MSFTADASGKERRGAVWVDGAAFTGRVTGVQRFTEGLVDAAITGPLAGRVHAFSTIAAPEPRPPWGERLRWRTALATRRALARADRLRAAPPLELLLRTRPGTFVFPDHLSFPVTPLSKSIVVVHDFAYLDVPEHVDDGLVRWLRRNVARAIARADRVCVVSNFVAARLAVHFPMHAHKTRVVPGGVHARFAAGAKDLAPLRALGLSPGYLLFIGTFEPRKNLVRVLDAYDALPLELRARAPLVVAGGRGWKDDAITARLARAGAHVRNLGNVDDAVLPALYAGARAFVWPSLYEGFGLPPLEAMAAGAPVVTSVATAVAEVVGDAALLVDPRDTSAIAVATERLLTDDALHAELSAIGRARAARFTWSAAASAFADVIAEVEGSA